MKRLDGRYELNGARFLKGIEAVEEARLLREKMESGELFTTYGVMRDFRCPLCFHDISQHKYKIPCWRYGEYDRYGLHVSATPPGFDNIGIFAGENA